MTNRFLNTIEYLQTDIKNITPIGSDQILTITDGQYMDPLTNKFKTSLLPNLAITTVSVVADITARDALTVESGDVCVVTNTPKETYIYNGSSWIEILSTDTLSSLSDTNISAFDNDILHYDSSSSKWISTAGPTITQLQNYINTMNQNVSSTATATFNGIKLNNSITSLISGAVSYTSGIFYLYDGVGLIDIRSLENAKHVHDQNLDTVDDVRFNSLKISDCVDLPSNIGSFYFDRKDNFGSVMQHSLTGDLKIWLAAYNFGTNTATTPLISFNITTGEIISLYIKPTIYRSVSTATAIVAGEFKYNSNSEWLFCDSVGNINLRSLKTDVDNMLLIDHTHTNKANLDTINQNLSTTSIVRFSQIYYSDGIIFDRLDNSGCAIFNNNTGDQMFIFLPYNIGLGTPGTTACTINCTNPELQIAKVTSLDNITEVITLNSNTDILTPSQFQYNVNSFIFCDSVGNINLRTLQTGYHTHSNKANLDTINQNLGTTSTVTHKKLLLDGFSNANYATNFSLCFNEYNNFGPSITGSTNSHNLFFNVFNLGSGTQSTTIPLIMECGAGHIITNKALFGNTALSPAYNLDIQGDQRSITSATFIFPSDERLKRDIITFDTTNLLLAYENLNIVTFKHKYNDIQHIGIVAQQLCDCPIFTSCITQTEDIFKYKNIETNEDEEVLNPLAFNMDNMVYMSCSAIKLLIQQNKDQQTEIQILKDAKISSDALLLACMNRLSIIEAELGI